MNEKILSIIQQEIDDNNKKLAEHTIKLMDEKDRETAKAEYEIGKILSRTVGELRKLLSALQ